MQLHHHHYHAYMKLDADNKFNQSFNQSINQSINQYQSINQEAGRGICE